MTRETKIGLVVGLGFIVVFAILLSHKGTAEHVGPPSDVWPRSSDLQLVDAGSAIDAVMRQPEEDDAPDAIDGTRVDGADAVTEVATDVPSAFEGSAPDAPSASAGIAPPAVATDVAPSDAAKGSDGTLGAPTDGAEDPAPITAEPATPAAPARDKEKPTAPPRRDDGMPEPVRPLPPTEHLVKKHVVQEGDTLFGLARHYYKTPATKVIDGIYQANKNRLANRDKLKPGQILSIPMDLFDPVADPLARPPSPGKRNGTSAGTKGPSGVKSDSGTDASKIGGSPALAKDDRGTDRKVAPPGRDWEWYQIRPKDTLYSIARKVLGTSTRWREIQSLNRSNVPDPRKLRPGDKIKIPVGRPPGLETAGLELPRS